MSTKTKTKIKNALLTIIGIPMAIIMFSEVQDQSYWWVQVVATVVVIIILRLSLGGKENDTNKSWR